MNTENTIINRCANDAIANYLISICATAYYCNLKDRTLEVLKNAEVNEPDIQKIVYDFNEGITFYVEQYVHPEDKENMLSMLSIDYVKERLKTVNSFSFTYRETYEVKSGMYRGFVIAGDDEDHVVVCFLNISEKFSTELEIAEIETEHKNLIENNERVLALEDNLESIYDVNLETGEYELFLKGKTFSEQINTRMVNNADFFADSNANTMVVVYKEDRDEVLKVVNRDYIIKELAKKNHIDLFYRLIVNDDTAWTKLRILYKNAEKKNIIIGVFNAEEEIIARQREEKLRNELINRMVGDDSLFIIDCDNNTRRTIHNHCLGAELYSDANPYSEEIEKYISKYVDEHDKEKMRKATAPSYMLKQLKSKDEFIVEYRDTSAGIRRFCQMRIAKFSDNEILQSFSERDIETVEKLLYDRLEDDYFALHIVDLEAGLVHVMRDVPERFKQKVGGIIPFNTLTKSMTDEYDNETKEFFEKIQDISYWKNTFKKEDKATFTYKSHMLDGKRWGNVTQIVLSRQEDGTPSLVTLAFSLLDEVASEKEDLQLKIREQLEIIGGVASEYTGLYYIDLKTGEYKNYVATDRISDTRDQFENFDNFSDLYKYYVNSDAVHPDYKQEMLDFYDLSLSSKSPLIDKKRMSFLFKRKYEEGYLWTEMIIVKCEDAQELPKSIVVGFTEKDDEVKQELEIQRRRKEAEESQKFIDNITNEYNIVYIVNMKDDSLEIRRMDDHMLEKDEDFKNFTEAKEYMLKKVIHPHDVKKIEHELDFTTITERLSKEPSYYVDYNVIKGGVTVWSQMNITAIGEDRIIIGFAERDFELIKNSLEEKKYQEYVALFIVDLDTKMIRVIKNDTPFKTAPIGEAAPYSWAMNMFAKNLTDEAQKFFKMLADVDYVKKEFAKEDKHTYSFKSVFSTDGKWVDVTSYVLSRKEDGEPEMFSLGFSISDSLSAGQKEVQIKLKENMEMIGGLASGYYTLYYFNIDENIYKIYSLDGEKYPELVPFVKDGGDPFELIKEWAKNLVHPDDRYMFNCLNAEYVRSKLQNCKTFEIIFRRKYDSEYLWTKMSVVKSEDIDEQANAVSVGFSENDAEIRSEKALNNCLSILGKEIQPAEAIDELLTMTGEFYGAERAYIFEYGENKDVINNTFEWCAEGVEPMIQHLQDIPSTEIVGWIKEFKAHGAFMIDTLDESAYNSEEGRKLLEMQRIESLVAAPIMNDDEIVGFVGVDNPTKGKKNIELLKNVSVVSYSEILRRKQTEITMYETAKSFADTFLESYVSAYYVNLLDYSWVVFSQPEDFEDNYSHIKNFVEALGKYIEDCVHPEDQEMMFDAISPVFIKKRLKKEPSFSFYLRDISKEEMRWFRFDVTRGSDENHAGIAFSDVTELLEEERSKAKQLEDARNAADEANRSKTKFLFSMSHDIRTPMNAIAGFTTMAKKHADDAEKVREYLEKIDISGKQLLVLINQVLEMARIESGKVEFESKPVNITEKFNSTVTVLSEQATTNGLNFHYALENIKHPYVLSDEARIGSITLNIAGNAMKYTPEGGNIDFVLKEIEPRKEGCGTYVLTVSDTGIGMSEEYQKELFEPFSREKNTTVSKIQGTGLGLSIVKSMVDLLGGKIEVHSELYKGTRFDITLDFPINFEEEASSTESVDVGKITFAGKRILLVEDNEMNREIAKDLLEDSGFVIDEADDGDVAVSKIQKIVDKGDFHYYDYVLMDVQMPKMNGYEATKEIRKIMLPYGVHIPIIAMTANAFEEDKQDALNAGMDAHFAKPIDLQRLLETIAKFT